MGNILDGLLGIKQVLAEGTPQTKRGLINFLGAVEVVDNAVDGSTDVTVGGVIGVTVVALFTRQGVYEGEPIVAKQYDTGKPRGGGLFYWAAAPGLTHNGATVVGTIGTGRWIRVYSGALDVTWFGAVGNYLVDGADDTNAIQAAIDYAIAGRIKVIDIPDGHYKITRPLHLCKVGDFHTVHLRGAGGNYDGSSNFCGTTIHADSYSDQPALNINGARGTKVSGLTFIGPLKNWIYTRQLALTVPLYSDTLATDWDDPSLAATADSRYAPNAAITIDGWSGSAPSPAYPTTYLAYGQLFSSDVEISDCVFHGFNTAAVVQPSDVDGNGDFVTFYKCFIKFCKYGFSVGNTQARNTTVDNCQMTQVYSCLASSVHGKRNGKFGTTIKDLAIYQCIQLYEFANSSGIYGPLKLQSCYGEGMWRLGNVGHTTTVERGLDHDACEFGFHLQTEARGIPAKIFSGGTIAANVRFSNTVFRNYPSVVVFDQEEAIFDGCEFRPESRESGTPKAYLAQMHNATCGGLVYHKLRSKADNRILFRQYNLDTLAVYDGMLAENGMQYTSRPRCIPAWIQNADMESATTTQGYKDPLPVPRYTRGLTKASFSSVTLLQDATERGKLTLVWSSLSDALAAHDGFEPGDLIYDESTGMVFAIRSRTTTTVIAEAQNNYQLTGGVYTTVDAFSTTTGNLYFLNCRLFTPMYPLLVDMDSGGGSPAVLTNVGRDDGFATFIDTELADGDRPWVNEHSDRWVSTTNGLISSRDSTAKTITLAGAVLKVLTDKRIPWWLRTPPANSATR